MFTKSIHTLLVVILASTLTFAQRFELIEIDPNHFCAAGPITEKPKTVYASDATQDIKDYVADIMKATQSVIQNLVVKSANTLNAFVTKKGTNKLLVYSESHFGKLRQNGGRWAVVGTLAHEIGHLHHKHELRHGKRDRKAEELEADWFMGYAIAKLGGSREQAFSAIHDFASEEATTDYPAKKDRLNAVALGWQTAKNDGKMVVNDPFSKSVNSNNTLISKLDDKLKYLMANYGYGADELAADLEQFVTGLDEETLAANYYALRRSVSGEKVKWKLKYRTLQRWLEGHSDYWMETEKGEKIILDIENNSSILVEGNDYVIEGVIDHVRFTGGKKVDLIFVDSWKVSSGKTRTNNAKLSISKLRSSIAKSNPSTMIKELEHFVSKLDKGDLAANHYALKKSFSGEKVSWRLTYSTLQRWLEGHSDYWMKTEDGRKVILDIESNSPILVKGKDYIIEGTIDHIRFTGGKKVDLIFVDSWKVVSGSTRSNPTRLSISTLKSKFSKGNPSTLVGQLEGFIADLDEETLAVNHYALKKCISGETVRWRLKYQTLQRWLEGHSDYWMETEDGKKIILDIERDSPTLTEGKYYMIEGVVDHVRYTGGKKVDLIFIDSWKIK